jgi:hypothetical protein
MDDDLDPDEDSSSKFPLETRSESLATKTLSQRLMRLWRKSHKGFRKEKKNQASFFVPW